MSLAIPALAALDPAAVAQVQDELAQRLAERFPEIELRRGVVHDVVLHLAAVLLAAEQRNVDTLRRSSSIKAILDDPGLADDEVVDRVFSNYRVARLPGAAARGLITIVLDGAYPVVVPSGGSFEAAGTTVVTEAAYAARITEATVAGPTDRALRPLGDGRFAFTIPGVARGVGVAGMLRDGAALVPGFAIPHLALAYADGDFAGGFEAESNRAIAARLTRGLAARAWSNRSNIDAMLHEDPRFARVGAVSIVGHGDAEMVRDRHGLFPVALGGRCDAYCRTAPLAVTTTLVKSATLVGVTAAGGTWQLAVARDDAPGFYAIARVARPDDPAGDAGYAVTEDLRGLDLSGPGWRPDVASAVEAAYSRYSTAVVRFLDGRTPTAGLEVGVASRDYVVSVVGLPLLAELQDFLGGRSVRNPGGDVLAKAPVPCFLSISVPLRKPAGAAEPDLPRLRQALADHVNALGFPGRIHASALAGALRDLLPEGAALGAFDLFGRIRRPDGTTRSIRDATNTALEIPEEPERMVGGRTVAFLLDPADVAIAVELVEAPEI